jgi:hypothetical protein
LLQNGVTEASLPTEVSQVKLFKKELGFKQTRTLEINVPEQQLQKDKLVQCMNSLKFLNLFQKVWFSLKINGSKKTVSELKELKQLFSNNLSTGISLNFDFFTEHSSKQFSNKREYSGRNASFTKSIRFPHVPSNYPSS